MGGGSNRCQSLPTEHGSGHEGHLGEPNFGGFAAQRSPMLRMVILLLATVFCGSLLAACQQTSVSHAACARGVHTTRSNVTLRLAAPLPYPSVTVQKGGEVKVEVSYRGHSMKFPNVVGTSACLLRATRHSDGSVTAVLVAKRPGRSKIFSTLNRATDANSPELGGEVVVNASRG